MIDLQFCSDHEQHSVEQTQLRELQLLHQPKTNSQIGPTNQFKDGSSSYSMSKKPKSPYADASSEITHNSTKKKHSSELSCELGLSIVDNPRRVCRICRRHFSSGRALGGHMRVHGPLFQPAGSKRKLNSVESKDPEERYGMEFLDSKQDLSLLSESIIDTEVGKVEDDVMSSFSESESEANVRRTNTIKESDNGDGIGEYYDFSEVVDNDHLYSGKKNPLYQLRHNPKRSRRFANDDFAMELLLSEQAGANTKGSTFSSLETPRVCSECGKAFWSWKALFGHMRCHPEREWRGILPPEASSVHEGWQFTERKPLSQSSFMGSSEDELESDVEDKDNYTEGGEKVSCENGEGGIKEKFRMVEQDEVTEEELAVMGSKIGNGEMFGEEDPKELAKGTAEGNDWNPRWPTAGKRSRRKSTEGKAESLQQVYSCPDEEEPALTSESTSPVELEDETRIEAPNFLFMLAEAARKIEQDTQVRKRFLQLWPDMPYYSSTKQQVKGGDEAAADVKYECSTCKKSFNSHQALGGHRASHRKMKGCFARTGDSPTPWQADVPNFVVDQQKQAKGHQCSVCHRMFSTGQALGGHKRCHYNSAESCVTSSNNNKHPTYDHQPAKLHDERRSVLDLNMPAEVALVELRLFHDNPTQSRYS